MEPERWQRIVELADAATHLAGQERAAFLREACAGDNALRMEVESLILSDEQSEGFIEAPVFGIAAELIADDQATSMAGQEVGAYKIINLLGVGGMGEVYLAEDTRLGRKAALKFLPWYLTSDKSRVRRFEQEARAASALNHPDILTVYEIGQSHDTYFIATEYIEGKTLRERMKSAPMPVSDVLEVAIQAANALAAAHQAGIVHRDIKPENIMLRPDGYIKVLDFGLAKMTEQRGLPGSDGLIEATITSDTGPVMGTAYYMSPEQARGLKVDGRTDIFSLGVVIYEMLTGQRPFEGETPSHVVVAILEKDPQAVSEITPGLPSGLDEIVTRALRKDRLDRYQTARDLITDLKSVKQGLELDTEPPPALRKRRRDLAVGISRDERVSDPADAAGPSKTNRKGWLLLSNMGDRIYKFGKFELLASAGELSSLQPLPKPYRLRQVAVWAAAVCITSALGAFVLLIWRSTSRTQVMASSRSPIPIPAAGDFVTVGANPAPVTLSPDGSKMVFAVWDGTNSWAAGTNSSKLWLRHMDTMVDEALRGTEGASFPFWGPNSRSLAFFADKKLKRLDFATGAVSVVCDSLEGRGGSWNNDGVIIFAAGARSPILRVDATGGAPVPVTILDNVNYTTHRWPEFLPDGVHFLFFAAKHEDESNTNSAVYVGTLKTKEMRSVVNADGNASFVAGHLLFVLGNRLYQQPFDERTNSVSAEPSLLAGDLEYDKGLWHGTFTASPDLLVYRKSPGTSQGARRLAWFARDGRLIRYVEGEGPFKGVTISPRTSMIAVEYGDPDGNIWLLDQTNDEMVKLTEQALDSSPVWSPDGKYIAINTHHGPNQTGVKIKSVGVGMSEIPVLESGLDVFGVTAWSPDGKDLLLAKTNGQDLEMSSVDWQRHSERSYLTLHSRTSSAVFSPDGHWVALVSTETGTMEVYVISFPNPTKRYRVSMAGGFCPVWRRDGRELFFLGPDCTLYATAITPGGSRIKIGPSRALFRTDIHVEGQPFDIDQTGTKFLLVLNAPRKHSDIMLLRNWVR